MTINALLFIAGPGINHVTVSQHGAAFIRDVQEIAMAFLALLVFERGVSFLPLLFMIILFLIKVDENVLGTMKGLGVEELQGILGRWQMAVHAVGHETLLVVHVG
jgi:hypothetical protein